MTAMRKIDVTIRKIFHRIAQWPSKTTHLVYSLGPIQRRSINNRASDIEAHRHKLPILTFQELPLAHALSERGFFRADVDLFESFTATRFRTAANRIYDETERTYLKTGKTIDIIRLLDANPSLLDQFKVIFSAGLDDKFLKIIEHYLKLPVAFGGVDIFFTVADGLEKGARTWHKDSEDTPMVKVAIYLNDVGDDDGPFEILHLQHKTSDLEKSRGFKQQKLIQAQNEGKIDFDITTFTGPAGSVIFCDTSKYYHRGKPATGKNRRALFYNYYASRPLTPYFCPNPPFSPDGMRDLVSGLSPTQKAAALWRENLTRFDKIVTKRKPYLNL